MGVINNHNINLFSSVEIKLILKQLSDHNRILCDTSGNKEAPAALEYDSAALDYEESSTQQPPQPADDSEYSSLNQSIGMFLSY